jgi:hypothetical protein
MAVLSTGEWLLPFWKEPHDAPPCYKENKGSAGVLRSRDKGVSWQVYPLSNVLTFRAVGQLSVGARRPPPSQYRILAASKASPGTPRPLEKGLGDHPHCRLSSPLTAYAPRRQVYGELTHPRTWLIENTLVERTDGSVLMIFRTTLGVLYQVIHAFPAFDGR